MGQWGAPLPHIALPVGLIIQLIGALSVLVNYRADIGAIMLIFFVTAATVIFHRFWQMDDPMRRNYHMLLLLNNVCIVAGLMLVV